MSSDADILEALTAGFAETKLPAGVDPEGLAELVLAVLSSEFGGQPIYVPVRVNLARRNELIRALHGQGLSQLKIASKAGCHRSTVSRVLSRGD